MQDSDQNHLTQDTTIPQDGSADLLDQELRCVDCMRTFIWSSGEQQFFATHGLQNPPKRCKPCKKAKTQRIAAIEESKLSGDRPRIEISVSCEKCGVQTTVPFFPSQGRPVYCRDCYKQGSGSSANAAGY